MSAANNNQLRGLGNQERFKKDAAIAATQRAAALRGAALAFGNGNKKPVLKPKPETYAGRDGALAAAAKVGGLRGELHGNGVDGEWSNGGASFGRNIYAQSFNKGKGGNSGNGSLSPGRQGQSASYLAANLAASRSPSVSPNVTGQSQPYTGTVGWGEGKREVSPLKFNGSERSWLSEEKTLDLSSIPPTTSLIDMFEKNKGSNGDRGRQERAGDALMAAQRSVSKRNRQSRMPSSSPPLKPRKPEATTRGSPNASLTNIGALASPPKPRILEPTTTRITPKAIPSKPTVPSSPLSRGQKPEFDTRISPNTQGPNTEFPNTSSRGASTSGQTGEVQKPIATSSKPIQIPRPQTAPSPYQENEYSSSDDSFVSASDFRPSFRAEIQNEQRSRLKSISNPSVNSVAVDSLANAIVASSLASSRAASPSRNLRAPAPPPSRRTPRSHRLFHNNEPSRSASPAKPTGLRTTMRKPKAEEVDEGAKRRMKKAHLMKKHPNKHHEGARKRWRDEITDRERKRYEAVWASNKGLYLPDVPGAENSVCNLVIRDIWSRSKLNSDVLEEAYALVDRQRNGMLGKDEFVVGLWLVDQLLKGRKLPIRVSESVWRSAGILRGLNLKDVKLKERKKKT